MAQPAHEPAWHPDPYEQGELRWHDGTQWTEHVHGTHVTAAPEPPAPPALPTGTPHLAGAVAPPALPAWNGTPTTSGKALAALITALAGVPVVSIVLGVLARRDIAASGGRLVGNGLALAGIVLGAINVLVIVLVLAFVLPLLGGQEPATDPNLGLTTAVNPGALPAETDATTTPEVAPAG